jgi:Caspase domain
MRQATMAMSAETGSRHPTDRKLGIIILGASTYPHFPPARNLDNESFARSAAAFRGLVADEDVCVFGKPVVLDLFNVDDNPTSIIRRIREFLKSGSALTDILFYYCGHGDFLRDRTYYLTLKETEPEYEAFTGLLFRQMSLALDTQLMSKRLFLVLDCCFSGQAVKEWMATGIGHVIEDDILRSFPREGTALIAASAGGKPAIAPEGERLTMFTGTLINTISIGVAGEKKELSFRDIVDEVRAQISERYGSAGAAPEIHAPRQDEGDITFVPFFVNRAFVPPPETKAEREGFEFAVADLYRWLPNTRVGAVETLEQNAMKFWLAGLSRPMKEAARERGEVASRQSHQLQPHPFLPGLNRQDRKEPLRRRIR